VNASDDDVGRNAEITYALADIEPPSEGQGQGHSRHVQSSRLQARTGGGGGQEELDDVDLCAEKFNIDPQLGVVTAKTRLDYEQRAIYRCRVLAVDAGQPPNTGQNCCIILYIHLRLFDFVRSCFYLQRVL